MVIIGKYNKSVILTYLAACTSILGMVLVYYDKTSYAIICLICSAILDLFDGKVARMCKRTDEEKEFGKQIDSLVDVISFIAFPSVLAIKLFENLSIFSLFVLVLYVICGIIRLAWFDIVTDKCDGYFIGVPLAYIALILPIVYTISLAFSFTFDAIYPLIYIIFSILFVLNVKVKKPTGVWYGIFSTLAVFVIVSIVVLELC